jgi:hypothetical protein
MGLAASRDDGVVRIERAFLLVRCSLRRHHGMVRATASRATSPEPRQSSALPAIALTAVPVYRGRSILPA